MAAKTVTDVTVDGGPIPSADLTHPHWCKQKTECAAARPMPLHVGLQTTWAAQSDDVELTVSLVRGDETLRGEHIRGDTRARLSLLNTAFEGVAADVELHLADLDLLIGFLNQTRQQMTAPIQFEMPTENEVIR